MKFGKQLELGIYKPWKDHYIQYNRLKRIINREKFLKDKKADKERRASEKAEKTALSNEQGVDMGRGPSISSVFSGFGGLGSRGSSGSHLSELPTKQPSGPSEAVHVTETTPLTVASPTTGIAMTSIDHPGSVTDDSIRMQFFSVIQSELDKINKFYKGKYAELRLKVDKSRASRSNAYLVHHASGSDQLLLNKLRELYVEITALRSYCELNVTGFTKIIKKHDKILEVETLKTWKQRVAEQEFADVALVKELEDIITGLVSIDKLVEWQRLAKEQQQSTAANDVFPAVRIHGLITSIAVLVISLIFPIITREDPCASRCMSLLLLTVVMWITQAIPYFATALLVPALVPLMGVLKASPTGLEPMSADDAANFVLDHIFNSTTMLLIGGYTISTSLARCQLELRIAAWMQRRFQHPATFILAIMFLGLFLSMWISNHTAPILCAAIVLPIVRDLPTDSRFSKTLLLALAYACNFGGMMTPISSLQNVLAVQYLDLHGVSVSFGQWLCVSIPFCILCTVFGWLWLIVVVRPDDIDTIPIIVYERGNKVLGARNITVIVLSLLTIMLFATFNLFQGVFGNIGIVALCFVIAMFSSGILTEVDFNSLPWHTLFLIGGGSVLGKAVESSGLLHYISDGIFEVLPLKHPWLALVMILAFCVAVSTFVSHTVASLILMPIITHIGVKLHMAEVAVIGSAFAVSAAMALPFSSFPNVNSLLLVDDFQNSYLTVMDFIKTGLPLSVACVVLIATLGQFLIKVNV